MKGVSGKVYREVPYQLSDFSCITIIFGVWDHVAAMQLEEMWGLVGLLSTGRTLRRLMGGVAASVDVSLFALGKRFKKMAVDSMLGLESDSGARKVPRMNAIIYSAFLFRVI